jgi:hypothetical protein
MVPNTWGPRTIKGPSLLVVDGSNYLIPQPSRVQWRWTRGHWVAFVNFSHKTYVFSRYGQLVESKEKSLARGRRWPEVP